MATVRHGAGSAQSDGRRGDLFPTLEAFTGGGALAGVIASMITGVVIGHGNDGLGLHGAFSGGLGAILGLFVGLSRGVWRSGEALRPTESVSGQDRLWDPWLDSGRDLVQERSGSTTATRARDAAPTRQHAPPGYLAERARVRPRVISPVTGEAIPLDDEIGPLLQEGRSWFVGIAGGPGSGKTTALKHLAAVLPPWALARVRLVDGPMDCGDVVAPRDGEIVILTGFELTRTPGQVIYSLAPWSKDDVIEYLLSAHWDRCASVMTRLKAADDRGFLKGIPELWTAVLDQMASDESILDVRAAIRSLLVEHFD